MNTLLLSFQKGCRARMATSEVHHHHHKNTQFKHRCCLTTTCPACRESQGFGIVGSSEISSYSLIWTSFYYWNFLYSPRLAKFACSFKARNRPHTLQQEPSQTLPIYVRCPFYTIWNQLLFPSIAAPINNALWFCYWLLVSKLPESNNINSFNKYWMNVLIIFTLPEPNTVSSIFKPSKLTPKGHIDINGSLLWIPDLYIPLPTLYLYLVTSKVLQNSLRTLYVLSATKKPALLQCSSAQWIQLWKPEWHLLQPYTHT